MSETVREWLFLFVLVLSICLLTSSMNSNNEIYLAVCWTLPAGLLLFLAAPVEMNEENSRHLIIKKILENKTMIFIGNISFELFLTHQLCIRYMSILFRRIGLGGSLWQFFCAAGLSMLASIT